MPDLVITTHVSPDGTLRLDLPQFRDVVVEVIVRKAPTVMPDQLAIFDIPSLAVDPHHTGLHLTSRDELYGDDGR
jgi:hypothetical protein